MKRKECKKVKDIHNITEYRRDDIALSRAKEDMIVGAFRVSTVAAPGRVHFMPFVSLEVPRIADIDPKVDIVCTSVTAARRGMAHL